MESEEIGFLTNLNVSTRSSIKDSKGILLIDYRKWWNLQHRQICMNIWSMKQMVFLKTNRYISSIEKNMRFFLISFRPVLSLSLSTWGMLDWTIKTNTIIGMFISLYQLKKNHFIIRVSSCSIFCNTIY